MKLPKGAFVAFAILCALTPHSQANGKQAADHFQSMCVIQINGQQLMETCNVTEIRDGQWRRGIRVVAPVHGYEMRGGVLSGCPKSASTWDSVAKRCYRFSWTSEPLPGNEGKSCPENDGLITPCKYMDSDNLLVRITPHLLVQGLTFG